MPRSSSVSVSFTFLFPLKPGSPKGYCFHSPFRRGSVPSPGPLAHIPLLLHSQTIAPSSAPSCQEITTTQHLLLFVCDIPLLTLLLSDYECLPAYRSNTLTGSPQRILSSPFLSSPALLLPCLLPVPQAPHSLCYKHPLFCLPHHPLRTPTTQILQPHQDLPARDPSTLSLALTGLVSILHAAWDLHHWSWPFPLHLHCYPLTCHSHLAKSHL